MEEPRGNGETLILVHGLGGSTNSWFPQMQVLRRDFRLFAYDLTGSGRSSAEGEISIARHVTDLEEIAAQAGPGQVHLAGHSMGSIICQHFAAAQPERVASLMLVGAFPEPPCAGRAALRDRAAKARTEGLGGIAEAIVAAGTSADTKVNQPAAAAFERESLMAEPRGLRAKLRGAGGCRFSPPYRITCPVLLLTGDEDRTASTLADPQVQTLAGCGHWATIERAKQVNYALTLFHARLVRIQRYGGATQDREAASAGATR